MQDFIATLTHAPNTTHITVAPILSTLGPATAARDNYEGNPNRETLRAHVRTLETLNRALYDAGVPHLQRIALAEMFWSGASFAELSGKVRTFQANH